MMKYPKSNKNSQNRFKIEGFYAGINPDRIGGRINHNQLADVLNMWWVGGSLKTRPGIKPISGTFNSLQGREFVSITGGTKDVSTKAGICRHFARVYKRNSGPGAVYDLEMSAIGYDGIEKRSTIAYGISESEFSGIMMVESGGGRWDNTAQGGAIAFIGQGGKGSDGQILAQPEDLSSSWMDITEKTYIPLVMVNGRGSEEIDDAQYNGTIYEGFNLLTPKFRVQFTTTDEKGRYYFLPVKQLDNSEVIVKYTEPNGNVYTYVIPKGSSTSQVDQDGLAVYVDRTGGYFYCYQPSNGAIRWFPAAGISNNLEVIASKTRLEGMDKICSMRICTWFGGDRSGFNGGSRLFVAGHRLFPNLIHWSDVNNPLYFPENNYAYIGDAGQLITAFAKHGEKLIIFKENEMYYATYTSGTRVSKYLPDGSVVDATANQASFPVVQLHSFIGCDCPDTIQLCDNRLLWATSSGRVYTLVPTNHVIEISNPIQRKLDNISSETLKSAVSGDYKGHYILLAKNEMFLLNYSDLKLQNTKANLISWMCWKFDVGFKPDFMMSNGNYIAMSGKSEISGAEGTINAVLKEGSDECLLIENGVLSTKEQQIEYMLQTGLFDFNHPERYKDVRLMYIELTGKPHLSASASFFDELGKLKESESINLSEGGLVRISPNATRIRCFGLSIYGKGSIEVGSIIIFYKLYGKAVR
jgi:hypothetical protein